MADGRLGLPPFAVPMPPDDHQPGPEPEQEAPDGPPIGEPEEHQPEGEREDGGVEHADEKPEVPPHRRRWLLPGGIERGGPLGLVGHDGGYGRQEEKCFR